MIVSLIILFFGYYLGFISVVVTVLIYLLVFVPAEWFSGQNEPEVLWASFEDTDVVKAQISFPNNLQSSRR